MSTILKSSLLVLCVVFMSACSKRYLETPDEKPAPAPEKNTQTELTDTRTPYVVDQPVIDPESESKDY